MKKQFIRPPGVYVAPGFSPAVRAGNTIYFSGQVAWDEEGKILGKGDMKAQIAQAFSNMEKMLEAAGGQPVGHREAQPSTRRAGC